MLLEKRLPLVLSLTSKAPIILLKSIMLSSFSAQEEDSGNITWSWKHVVIYGTTLKDANYNKKLPTQKDKKTKSTITVPSDRLRLSPAASAFSLYPLHLNSEWREKGGR